MDQFKPFLVFCALALSFTFASASHNVSGRIEYELMGSNTCLFRLITFSDPSAALVDRCTASFEIWNAAGTVKIDEIWDVPRINGPATDPNFPQVTCSNATMGEYVTSTIKRNVYEATYTFSSADTYEIRYTDLGRIDNIANMSNSGSTAFFVNAVVNVSATWLPNHSPVINNDTTLSACAQQPWFNNLNITDPDGDSLSFKIVDCLQYDPPSIPAPILATGYGKPGAVGGGYFWVGPMGNVLWQNASNMIGPYSYALEIEEWRNGVQIGKVFYDGMVFVLPNNCFVSVDPPQPNKLITAYPNPANETITLNVSADLLQLYDMQGKLLREAEMTDQVEVGDLPVGNYLLRVKSKAAGRSIRISIRR